MAANKLRTHVSVGGNRLHALIDINQISIAMGSQKGSAARYTAQELCEIFREIENDFSCVDTVNNYGETALHMAVSQPEPSPQLIRKVLELNPSASQCRNCNGNIPLHLLCLRSIPDVNMSVIKMLVAAYPDGVAVYNCALDKPYRYYRSAATPIHVAVKQNKTLAILCMKSTS